ncbi:MAG: hypothetical protein AAF570_28070 [Bacteroidota bacterium]
MLLIFCCCGAFFPVKAAATKLEGKFEGGAWRLVILHRARDYVSWDRQPVAMALTDANGNFSLS